MKPRKEMKRSKKCIVIIVMKKWRRLMDTGCGFQDTRLTGSSGPRDALHPEGMHAAQTMFDATAPLKSLASQ
jgi:hypothetical protein